MAKIIKLDELFHHTLQDILLCGKADPESHSQNDEGR